MKQEDKTYGQRDETREGCNAMLHQRENRMSRLSLDLMKSIVMC